MSEKGELADDQVSLPPNYAPSEAYTESPPPAYSTKKSSVVAVTRMVCLTLLAGAFMIGFFSLTHSWMQERRACNCQCDELDNMRSASFVEFPPAPRVASLVSHKEEEEASENTIITDINNNVDQLKDALNEQDMQKVEQNIQLLESDVELPTIIDEEIASLQEEVNILDQVEEEIEDERQMLEESEQQEMEDLKKKIKIPLDIILGNPALAGKDVNCEVERHQKEIGGVMTQAIIVKCHDKDDGPSKPLGMPLLSSPSSQRALGPPLSLLAPIMKMLSAKAKQRANQINSMNINGPSPMDGLKQAIMASLGGAVNGPIRIIRGPMSGPISGPGPFPMPSARFLPIRGPIMSGPRSPIPEIRGPIMSGPRSPIPEIRGSFMSGQRSPIPEIKSIPMPNFNGDRKVSNEGRQPRMFPMSFNQMKNDNGRQPKMISMPINPMRFDESRQPKMIPMSFNPMRIANGRSIRVLPFMKEQRPDGFTNLPNNLPPFPRIPSGFPLKNIQEFRNLPEPQPRGLNSPIALPELRILPGRFINAFPKPTPPVSLTENAEIPKPITHMEMRQPVHKPVGPVVIPNFKPEGPEFGPPKVHTVIGPPKNLPTFKSIHPPMALPEGHPLPPHFFNPHKPTFAPAPLHPTFAPAPLHPDFTSPHTPLRSEPSPPAPPHSHPHPKINPEGLTGIVTEINSDAEVFQPMGDHASTAPTPRKHHLLVLN